MAANEVDAVKVLQLVASFNHEIPWVFADALVAIHRPVATLQAPIAAL